MVYPMIENLLLLSPAHQPTSPRFSLHLPAHAVANRQRQTQTHAKTAPPASCRRLPLCVCVCSLRTTRRPSHNRPSAASSHFSDTPWSHAHRFSRGTRSLPSHLVPPPPLRLPGAAPARATGKARPPESFPAPKAPRSIVRLTAGGLQPATANRSAAAPAASAAPAVSAASTALGFGSPSLFFAGAPRPLAVRIRCYYYGNTHICLSS